MGIKVHANPWSFLTTKAKKYIKAVPKSQVAQQRLKSIMKRNWYMIYC